jgi:prevent-host-death family protein
MEHEQNIEEARRVLGDIVDRAAIAGEHFTITRNGKPKAVIVGLDWYESAQALIRGSQGRPQHDTEEN